MKIFDLLIPEFSEDIASVKPFPDYFYDDDSLFEATLLDLLHYVLYRTTALLIDLRTAMYLYDQGNTLVIVFRGTREVILNDNFKQRQYWMIGDLRFTKTEQGLELLLPLIAANIKINAEKVGIYIGNAKDIGAVQASIPDGIAGYLQTTPHWDTEFEVLAASNWGL